MSKSNSNFSRHKAAFVKSKGFYAAVALCLTAAGAATWLAMDRTVSGIEQAGRGSFVASPAAPNTAEVEKKQPDIPKVIPSPVPPAPTASMPAATAPADNSAAEAASAQRSSASNEPNVSAEESRPVEAPRTLTFTLPLSGDVVKTFSGGELVKNTTLNDWRTHDGVDIAAPEGSDIFAAADGIVKEVTHDPLWGTILVISHVDGKESIYSGLAEAMPVQVGETVTARQAVGKLMGVPCEMGEEIHLHFAVRQGNSWLDPLSILQ